jgi:hypothetical protein
VAVDIERERAVETFKSLIQISDAGFKLLTLLNGGAAVAILAYLGNIAGKGQTTPDMILPMFFYLFGLVLCGVAVIGSYMTQLVLFNEVMERGAPPGSHKRWLLLTMGVVVLSLIVFAIGSFIAVVRFGSIDGVHMEQAVAKVVTRGAESWQFFAFMFGALIVLFYGLIDELPERVSVLGGCSRKSLFSVSCCI